MEEYSEEIAEKLKKDSIKWINEFFKTEHFKKLKEKHKEHAGFIIDTFIEFMYNYYGQLPQDWRKEDVIDCLLFTFPRKVSAQKECYESISYVLASFLNFLSEKKIIKKPEELSKSILLSHSKIVKNCLNPKYWGPAKTIVMQAMEAGFDPTDKKQMEEFIFLYNLSLTQEYFKDKKEKIKRKQRKQRKQRNKNPTLF